MRSPSLLVLALCGLALFLSACGDTSTPPPAQAAVCTCDQGRAGESVWCEACGHGWVDGKQVTCKTCFEGRTGHDLFCEHCQVGYVDGKKVTECKGCFDALKGGPPCEACAAKEAAAAAKKTDAADTTDEAAGTEAAPPADK